MNASRTLTFQAIEELEPGEKIRAVFTRHWSGYHDWFLREGAGRRPTYARCLRALREHMPEIVPLYETLCELVGGGDLEARFLSLYCPTPFLTGCSQAIWKREEVALVRNYDYAPQLCDGVLLHSAWTGPRVIAMTDCLWGVLDGINEHGLTVALSFGGRRVVGKGFAITIVLRYILETCRDTPRAVDVLRRVPSHMSYNVSIVDRRGRHATVFVAPDRPTKVTEALVTTNHQGVVEWPEHAELTETRERERFLCACVDSPDESLEGLVSRFLAAPLYRAHDRPGWRTLYTAAYHPAAAEASFLWPHQAWRQTFDRFVEAETEALSREA